MADRTPLHDAAEAGDMWAVRDEIARGADLEALTAGYKETPLHRASVKGHADAVQALLDAGADVNAERAGGFTPLHLADNVRVAELLLRAGVYPGTTAKNGRTAAEHCAGGADVQRFIAEYDHGPGGPPQRPPTPPPAEEEPVAPPPPPEPAKPSKPFRGLVIDAGDSGSPTSGADEPVPPPLVPEPEPEPTLPPPEEPAVAAPEETTYTPEQVEPSGKGSGFSFPSVKVRLPGEREKTKEEKRAEKLKKLGNAAFKQGDYESAIAHYSDAIATEGTQPAFYTNRAVALLKLGRYEEAKADGLEAVKVNQAATRVAAREGREDDIEHSFAAKGYMRAAQACGHLGDYVEMRGLLSQAFGYTPALETAALRCEAAEAALRCGKPADAVKEASRAVQLSKDDSPLASAILGDAHAAERRWKAARDEYEKARRASMRVGVADDALRRRIAEGMRSVEAELAQDDDGVIEIQTPGYRG